MKDPFGERDLSLVEPCGCFVGANADDQLALRRPRPLARRSASILAAFLLRATRDVGAWLNTVRVAWRGLGRRIFQLFSVAAEPLATLGKARPATVFASGSAGHFPLKVQCPFDASDLRGPDRLCAPAHLSRVLSHGQQKTTKLFPWLLTVELVMVTRGADDEPDCPDSDRQPLFFLIKRWRNPRHWEMRGKTGRHLSEKQSHLVSVFGGYRWLC